VTPAPDFVDLSILRERERLTAERLREIDIRAARLAQAKAERERALLKIRTLIALAGGPTAPDSDED
jgi:hypothetical protein